jgi:hypothetical protein
MTKTTNADLEGKLGEFYAQVPPPPGQLVSGRERMIAEAARLKARAPSHSLTAGNAAETKKTQRRGKMKLFLAYKILAAVTAIVMGTTAAGGGVAFAAANSLPGDALYPVKLFIEDTRLSLISDPTLQAELTLDFADERALEMQGLIAQGKPVPVEAIARMAQHTEQVMFRVAQAQPEEVPGLLERVMERTRAQERVLEQVRALAPAEAQPALQQALQVTRHAYETASAAREDAERFQNEYRRRLGSTPGPGGGEASPSHTTTPPGKDGTPIRDQHQNREQEQNQSRTVTPSGTQQQDRVRDRERSTTPTPELSGSGHTSTPEPDLDRNREQEQNQNQAATPSGVQQHDRDRDRDRDRNTTHTPEPPGPDHTPTPELDPDRERRQEQDQNRTCTPTCTPQPDPDRDRGGSNTHTPPPLSTPEPEPSPTQKPRPTHTPEPQPTPMPAHTPEPQPTPMPAHTPMPTHTPKHGGSGG